MGGDDVHSGAFKAHVTRVLGGVDMCISLLDDTPTLNAALSHLQGQHKERGINPGYFDVSTLQNIHKFNYWVCF